ncbi:MAG TPA: phosphotransferase [Pseudonocardia sp.]|nr:phosphotransferase [Pseudonocardia sp.]
MSAVDGTDRRRVTEAAVDAAVRTARAHGLRVDEPVVLHDLFSLRVHLRPAPVVARIPTFVTRLRAGTDWIAREIDVVDSLARGGAPVVAPSAELPPGPHQRDGITMSFWTHVRVDPDRTATAADCAAMLPALHGALARYPGELPALGASAVDLDGWLGALDPVGHAVPEADLARLHAAARRLRPVLDVPGPTWRTVHGDAHAGNLLATADGLLWNDFEETCRGPAEWDLATLADDEAVHAHHQPDPALLAACRELRTLQVALCLIHLRAPFADLPGWDGAIRDTLAALPHGPDEPG